MPSIRHSLIRTLITALFITLIGQGNLYASIDDVVLKDITPVNLQSHSAKGIAIYGDSVLTLGAGNELLNVYDMRDIVNPRRTAIIKLPAQASKIIDGGTSAYILCPDYGLLVLDMNNVYAPRISAEYPFDLGPDAGGVQADGYLYINNGLGTLTIYELPRVFELVEVGRLNIEAGNSMRFLNGYIYMNGPSLSVVNVTDPTTPAIAEQHTLKGYVLALDIADGLVAAIDDANTLTLMSISVDGALTQLSTTEIGEPPVAVALGPALVAVATSDNLISFNISKPDKPVAHGTLPLVCELRDIKAHAGMFYLASELDGPLVADLSDPLRQHVVAYQAGLGLVSTIASKGNLMLAGSWDSIRALERREQGDMSIVGIQHSEGFTKEMQLAGDFAYLADPTRGLRVFNVSRPQFMRPVALLELPGTPSDVEIVGELAFVALGDAGIAQVNIHFPFSPLKRMMIDTGHPCTNITRAGDYLYFIGPDGYVAIYDVSNSVNPREAAWMQLPGISPVDAVVRGDMMAVAAGDDGMWLLNVSAPLKPVLRAKYVTDGSVETAGLFDGGAVLEVKGPGFAKIELIDLRRIFAPFKRDELMLNERSDYQDKIHVVGDRAYLAAYNYGMKVIELKGLLD